MPKDRSVDLLDYLIIILKSKIFLISLFIFSFLISYTIIYFYVDKEYDSMALILPLEDTSLGGISSIVKNLKDLPLGLGGTSKSASTDLYITLIYSRTNLEDLIDKFDLMKDYNVSRLEEAVKALANKIESEETRENAFRITVRTISPEKSVKMVNYIIEQLNNKVIQLNVAKSRNNRIFLEERYEELKTNLKAAEDSLQQFQQRSGLFEAKEQLKIIATAFSDLEVKVLAKETEMKIIEELLGKNSPQYESLKSEYEIISNQLSSLQKTRKNESLLLPLKSLPEKAKQYLRYYRDVEIYNTILEYLVPLYEQAKIEEQKSIPVLQVIDYGNKPEKKSYPPRLLFSLIISIIVTIMAIFFLIFRSKWTSSQNPKVILLKKNISFKDKSTNS